MLFVGVLLVGAAIPANAFRSVASPGVAATALRGAQKLDVDADAAGLVANRDAFTTMSWSGVLASQYGNGGYQYAVTGGSIRWPFPFVSPITDGFGWRVAPCYGCSSYHRGIDFAPGGGSPIYVVADGVVTFTEQSDWGLGNHVVITSTINGQSVAHLYAHLQWGSSPLQVGSAVKVGDFVGLVGQTGAATGNHLHFEITVDGEYVDPFAWLTQNAN